MVDFQLGVKLDSILPQIFAKSLLNATLGFAILAVTSSSMCTALETVLPR